MDADRNAPGIGQARVRRERPRQVGVGRHAAGVVAGDDAERHELAGHGHDPRFDVGLAVERDVDGDEPRGGLQEHAGRRAVIGPTDHAPGRVRRGRAQSGRPQRGVADEQAVMVVRPQRDPPTGRDTLEVVGSRPAAPLVDVPAEPFQPRVGIGQPRRGRRR